MHSRAHTRVNDSSRLNYLIPVQSGCRFLEFFLLISDSGFFLITDRTIMKIYRIEADSQAVTEIPIPAGQLQDPTTVDYDPVDDRIYWFDRTGSPPSGERVIRSALLSGMDAREEIVFDSKQSFILVIPFVRKGNNVYNTRIVEINVKGYNH